MKDTKKNKAFQIRITEEEYNKIKELSQKHNMSMSQYVLFTALNNDLFNEISIIRSEINELK